MYTHVYIYEYNQCLFHILCTPNLISQISSFSVFQKYFMSYPPNAHRRSQRHKQRPSEYKYLKSKEIIYSQISSYFGSINSLPAAPGTKKLCLFSICNLDWIIYYTNKMSDLSLFLSVANCDIVGETKQHFETGASIFISERHTFGSNSRVSYYELLYRAYITASPQWLQDEIPPRVSTEHAGGSWMWERWSSPHHMKQGSTVKRCKSYWTKRWFTLVKHSIRWAIQKIFPLINSSILKV